MQNTTMTTKKAITVLGVLVFLIGMMFVIPAKTVGVKKNKPKSLLETKNDLVLLNQDTNNNNTPDWKDLLMGEMSTTTKNTIAVDEATRKRLEDPNNITASFSKNIYTATAYAKQQGTLTEEQKQALAIDIAQKESEKLVVKTYEATDLHLVKKETPLSRKTYSNSLGTIYKKNNIAKFSVNDIELVKAYTTTKDTAILEKFVVKKNTIDTVITQLLAMDVPYSSAAYHLLVINSLSGYEAMLDNLSKAKEDPMRAAIAFNSYTQVVKSMYASFTAMQEYFNAESITFTPSDPGYILTKGQ